MIILDLGPENSFVKIITLLIRKHFEGDLFPQSRLHQTKKASGCSFPRCLENIELAFSVLLPLLQALTTLLSKGLGFLNGVLGACLDCDKGKSLTCGVFALILLLARKMRN